MLRTIWHCVNGEESLYTGLIGDQMPLSATRGRWGPGAVTVGSRGVTVHGAVKSRPGLGPRPAAATNEFLDGRAGNLFLQRREQLRLEPVGTLERGVPSGRACQGVVGVLHPQQLLGLGGGMLGHHTPQRRLHLLILPFSLPVGLGMKSGRQTHGGPHKRAELPPEHRGKLGSPVGDHIDEETMEPEDVE